MWLAGWHVEIKNMSLTKTHIYICIHKLPINIYIYTLHSIPFRYIIVLHCITFIQTFIHTYIRAYIHTLVTLLKSHELQCNV